MRCRVRSDGTWLLGRYNLITCGCNASTYRLVRYMADAAHSMIPVVTIASHRAMHQVWLLSIILILRVIGEQVEGGCWILKMGERKGTNWEEQMVLKNGEMGWLLCTKLLPRASQPSELLCHTVMAVGSVHTDTWLCNPFNWWYKSSNQLQDLVKVCHASQLGGALLLPLPSSPLGTFLPGLSRISLTSSYANR